MLTSQSGFLAGSPPAEVCACHGALIGSGRCPKIPAEGSGLSGPSVASFLLVAVREGLPQRLGVREGLNHKFRPPYTIFKSTLSF